MKKELKCKEHGCKKNVSCYIYATSHLKEGKSSSVVRQACGGYLPLKTVYAAR